MKSGVQGIAAEVATTYFRLFDFWYGVEGYNFDSKPVEDGIIIGFPLEPTYPAVRCPQ